MAAQVPAAVGRCAGVALPPAPRRSARPAGPGRRGRKATGGGGDPHRNAKLAGLGVGVAVLAYLWFGRGSPDVASAGEMGTAITSVTTEAGEVRVPSIAAGARRVAAWRDRPIPRVGRNLFRRSEQQPAAAVVVAPEPPRPEAGELWRGFERSLAAGAERALAARAERQRREAAARRAAVEAAAGLRAESVILGPRPTALVDGRVMGIGDATPGGARIAAIDAAGLLVEAAGLLVRVPSDPRRPARVVGDAPPAPDASPPSAMGPPPDNPPAPQRRRGP